MRENASFHEKRAYPRVALNLPVRYRVMEETAGLRRLSEIGRTDRDVQTRDTSLGGLCILQDGRLSAGNILSLKLTLPGRPESLQAFADVVWASGSGAGLKFLVMKEQDSQALSRFLGRFPSSRKS